MCNKPQGQTYFLPLKTIYCDPIFERHCRKSHIYCNSARLSGKMYFAVLQAKQQVKGSITGGFETRAAEG